MADNQRMQLSDEWQTRVDAMSDSAGKTFRTSEALMPNTTQYPNFILDWIMPLLTGEEFKVLSYVVRRTLGFRKQADEIAISQIANGLTKRGIGQVDLGTGLSGPTILKALGYLENDLHIIIAQKSPGQTTYYRMNDGQDDSCPLHLEAIASREAQIQERQKAYGLIAAERARDPNRRNPPNDPLTALTGKQPLTHPLTALNAPIKAVNTQNKVETKIETKGDNFVSPLELRTPPIGAGGLSTGNGGQVRKEQLAADRVARAAAKAEAKAALDAMDGQVREALLAFQAGISNGGKVKPLLPQTIEKDGKVIRDMLQAGYTPEQIGEAAKWLREKWPAMYKVSPVKLAENIHEWDEDGSSGQGQGQRYVPFEVVN